MGGKHKQANRTKNNARPASSGRSAELLGSKAPPFVGFNVLKPVMTNFSDEVDPEINQDFQLVLKKMNKKDATTKLKALQEFTTLCRESDPAAVKAILPFWPRLYCALATDMEHRVREGAHAAHRAVVASVGRNIAPHLKQLAGPWFTGQYDTYAPAASTATLAFQEAFPPNKITEAIIFCQEEILGYIFSNLLTHTAQSLSNEKKNNAEEMEAKYQRVIISSLHGYGFYLNRLPAEQIHSLEETNKHLVGSAKFWKYAKHEIPLIRAAWFTALISLCQKAPFLLVNEGKHLGTAVFGNLDEADPTVLPIVWEAALHTLVVVEDMWKHVSAEKLVFPKLWRILREGGQGNAAMIFPNMLPLLSKIPQSVIGTKQEFFTKFFDSMRAGLKLRSVQLSTSEMKAIITSFIECVRYLVMVNSEDTDLCHSILMNQIFPLIESAMIEEKLQHGCPALFSCLSKLIRYWTKQNEDIYNNLLSLLWEKLLILCKVSVNNAKLDKDLLLTTLYAQNSLLMALKNPELKRQKKHLKVKFATPENSRTTEDKEDLNDSFKSISIESSELFDENLDKLKNKLICLYMELTNNNFSIRPLLVEQISKVVREFDSNQTFKILIESIGDKKSWQEIYNTKLLDWLLDDLVPVEYSLTIIFTLLQYVTDQEKCLVLQDLTKTRVNDILQWCVQQDNSSYPILKEWLHSDQLVDILVSVALNVSRDDLSYNILDKCLRVTREGKLLISQNAMTGILKTFITTLTSPKTSPSSLTYVAQLIQSAILIDTNYSYIIQENSFAPSLLIAMFRSVIQNPNVIELKDAWNRGVTILSKTYGDRSPRFIQITEGIIQIIMNYFNERVVDITETQQFASLIENFIFSAISYDPEITEVDDQIETFIVLVKLILDALVTDCEKWHEAVLRLCMNGNHVGGILNIAPTEQEPSNEEDPLKKVDVEKYIVCSYFQLELLYSFSHGDSESSESSLILTKTNLNELSSYLSNSVYLYSLGQTFQQYFSKTKQYFTLKKHILQVERYLKTFLEDVLETETIKLIASIALTNALTIGEQWLRIISIEIPNLPKLAEALKEVLEENMESSEKATQVTFTCLTCDQLIENCVDIIKKSDDLAFLLEINASLERIGDNLNESVCDVYDSFFDRVIGWNPNDLCFVNQQSNFKQLNSIANTAKFLCLALKFYSNHMKQSHWDVCMVRVASWIQGVHASIKELKPENGITIHWVRAVSATCRLMDSITKRIVITEESDEIAKTRHNEWNDVFVSTLHKTLIQAWYCVAERSCKTSLELLLIENLSEVVSEHVMYPHFIDDTSGNSVRNWLSICCKLIKSPVTSVQLTAYSILNKLIPAMVTMDSEYSETESGGLSCLCLEETLHNTQTVVDTMMSELRFGDTCIVKAFTDSYTYARAYLLLWATLLELCAQSNSQLRSLYTAWLKEEYLPVLMKTVFCLMPESVVHEYGIATKRTHDLFANIPQMNSEVWDSDKLSQVSCWVYTCALRRLPAAIRQWWNKSEHKVWTIVEHITATFISPLLCAEEMKAIKKEEKKFENMTILVHPSVREIVAVYLVEECSMELVIQLANNHPLGLVKVNSVKCMVSTAQIKQWLLQLTIFLTHQNGTIWDGLALWKNSLDKRFEGVEECYICFSILHNTSHQLPKLSCQTCRKKFHSPCLYKWFTTSNKSTCPICRNLF